MSDDSHRFVVITGGPGSGKSTLIDALAREGYAHSEEAGRAIIQDQTAIGGPALPWIDPSAFAELMLCWELRSLRLAREQEGTVFFDRGIPDIVGYLRLMKRSVPAHLETAARRFRYHRTVFVAPPWPEIFAPDAERRQTPAEAEATHAAMVETYGGLGYELVDLPKAPVAERRRFVLDRLGEAGPLTPAPLTP
ncbi:AAA family ATPase [Azospirillum argentinense]